MTKIGQTTRFSETLLSEIKNLTQQNTRSIQSHQFEKTDPEPKRPSFQDYLTDSIKDLNTVQKDADKAVTDLSNGATENIHETMLKTTQAELSFNLMVQIRNKALSAYQEVMRMPV